MTVAEEIITVDGTLYKSITEGKATILFPSTNEVFYNPVQVFNRDMSIAAIQTWSQLYGSKVQNVKNSGKYRVLEALAASGLRSIRYAKELDCIEEIVANDLIQEAVENIEKNVKYNGVEDLVKAHKGDALDLMYQSRSSKFHVVDLDPYGTAAPFLDAAIQCIEDNGLLCITCTDMAVLCGKYPETCFVKYASVANKAEYCHEMSLRIVLHTLQGIAARYKKKIIPLMSCSIDFYVRLFVTVETSADRVRSAMSDTGIVYQCSGCPNFTLNPMGRKKDGKFSLAQVQVDSHCLQCGSVMHLAGPLWSAPIHNKDFVSAFIAHLKINDAFATHKRMLGMATVISEELVDAPLYYSLPQVSSTIKANCPSLTNVMSAILNAGFQASITHCYQNCLKTNAPQSLWWDIMRQWAKDSNVAVEKVKGPGKIILEREMENIVDFTVHPLSNPPSRQVKLLRFEDHRGQNHGPKPRAKKRRVENKGENE